MPSRIMDEADRFRAAEARHGGRYITGALARAIDNDERRARFAGEQGPEALADMWRYAASPSGAAYPGSGRDTTQRYAISAARIGGVDWEHSAYWKPQPLAESVFDWPVYVAALTPLSEREERLRRIAKVYPAAAAEARIDPRWQTSAWTDG